VSNGSESPGLGEAASRFLTQLPAEDRGASQQEIYKFVRWYGWERPFSGLSAPEVANYAERLSQSDTDYAGKLDMVRTFLAYAKKAGWSKGNLAVHLKARKGKTKVMSASRQARQEAVSLTQQGYDELQAEIAALRDKRLQVIDDMRRAAADKDFSENAPLDAAKEQRGHIEGRIMELEGILKSAVIIDEKREVTNRVDIGDTIVLQDLASGEEVRYTLVSPREVDPVGGKISNASPIGKAAIGKSQGDMIEVTVPAGKLRYRITAVEG
jgi:transcription elongation factor GreA